MITNNGLFVIRPTGLLVLVESAEFLQRSESDMTSVVNLPGDDHPQQTRLCERVSTPGPITQREI